MTDRYAVIGNPISHSKSPLIHSLFAKQTAQDISYQAIEAPLDGFAATIDRLRSEGYKGCNVTVPFKEHAFQLKGTIHSEDVDNAQAANTLKFSGSKIQVENTDGVGLVRDLEQNRHFNFPNKQVLLMGAGGAAKGVLLPLRRALRHADSNITIANRTIDKARHLARGSNVSICSYEELAGKKFDLIINATSAGLTDSEVPLPKGIFAEGALAYDMMYGRETPFMKFARSEGVQVADGLGMLVEQAAEAFYIWRGVRPDTATVIAALRTSQH